MLWSPTVLWKRDYPFRGPGSGCYKNDLIWSPTRCRILCLNIPMDSELVRLWSLILLWAALVVPSSGIKTNGVPDLLICASHSNLIPAVVGMWEEWAPLPHTRPSGVSSSCSSMGYTSLVPSAISCFLSDLVPSSLVANCPSLKGFLVVLFVMQQKVQEFSPSPIRAGYPRGAVIRCTDNVLETVHPNPV